MAIRKIKLDELGRKNIDEFHKSPKYPIILVLDNIRSSYNVGSIFRTADAFLIEKIILIGRTPCPDQDIAIAKTALSATNSVRWEYVDNGYTVVSQLKLQGYTIVALEQTNCSEPLHQLKLSSQEKFVILCGNEIEGISEQLLALSDKCVEIPQEGTKHSLNVSIAVAISLWHFYIHYIHVFGKN